MAPNSPAIPVPLDQALTDSLLYLCRNPNVRL